MSQETAKVWFCLPWNIAKKHANVNKVNYQAGYHTLYYYILRFELTDQYNKNGYLIYNVWAFALSLLYINC